MSTKTEFLIGQRVVYSKYKEIVVILDDFQKREPNTHMRQWIRLTSGVELYVDPGNLSPLPNGQV